MPAGKLHEAPSPPSPFLGGGERAGVRGVLAAWTGPHPSSGLRPPSPLLRGREKEEPGCHSSCAVRSPSPLLRGGETAGVRGGRSGSWSPCAACEPSRLPMNLCVHRVSVVKRIGLEPQRHDGHRDRGSETETAGLEPRRSAGLQTGSNTRGIHEPNWSSAFRFTESAGVREDAALSPASEIDTDGGAAVLRGARRSRRRRLRRAKDVQRSNGHPRFCGLKAALRGKGAGVSPAGNGRAAPAPPPLCPLGFIRGQINGPDSGELGDVVRGDGGGEAVTATVRAFPSIM